MVVGIATPVRETELHLLVLDILDFLWRGESLPRVSACPGKKDRGNK
jgi:hypothetical protein